MDDLITYKFGFINHPDKMILLKQANTILNINTSINHKILFVYSAPKVGSTSIVSSFRVFGLDKIDIIHLHDENMLSVLTNIHGISINEIILYNKFIGKEVYVINAYRTPIERKISYFFELIGTYHFNTTNEKINTYNISRIITRFNNIFSHLENGDHFIDRYNINYPEHFDWVNKYLLVKDNGINYISLRLTDSNEWGNILTNIFNFKICIVKDYTSNSKNIKELYNLFNNNYKIPINYLNEIMESKYFNYYYSPLEKQKYFDDWALKSTIDTIGYNLEQYKVYNNITIENSQYDFIQGQHYMDEGCKCKACSIKRKQIANKLIQGATIDERIYHVESKAQLIQRRIIRATNINNIIRHTKQITRGKDFKQEMINVVRGKRNK